MAGPSGKRPCPNGHKLLLGDPRGPSGSAAQRGSAPFSEPPPLFRRNHWLPERFVITRNIKGPRVFLAITVAIKPYDGTSGAKLANGRIKQAGGILTEGR